MDSLLITLAQAQQQAIGRAFLLIVVLIIVGVVVVLGLVMAGYAYYARQNVDEPKRKDRFKGVDPWEESGRRATKQPDALDDDEDWEADDEDDFRR